MGDGHDHGNAANKKRVLWALLLAFMVAEVVGGAVSGSLALIADAGHMLTDSAALALSWFAFRMARRPADSMRSYGYHRVQVVAAFVNGMALVAITVWIVYEAAHRLFAPVVVEGGLMSAVAVGGLVVNILGFIVLSRGDSHNLNMRGAAIHVLGDLLGSVAAIVAGIVIVIWGWMPIDPILSVLVALLVLRAAYSIIRKSSRQIPLEGTPEDVDPGNLKTRLTELGPDVEEIHHVHIWSADQREAGR